MSRYVLEATERREVVVGWDPPLGTFFAQIYAPQAEDDEEEAIWWIGYQPHEVPTLRELDEALASQGVALTHEIGRKLAFDMGTPWEPGPLQKKLGFTG